MAKLDLQPILDLQPVEPEKPQGELVPIRRPEGQRGVFDYDKQLDKLLGTENLDDFIPFDDKYDFGRIIKMTKEPGETEDKVKLSMLYKSIADIDPKISFNMMDELNKVVVGEPSTPTKAWGRIKERYQTGKSQVQMMDLGFNILGDTWKDWEKYDENIKNIQKLQSGMSNDQRKEFRAWWEKVLGATAEQLPIMYQALKEAPEGAMAGGILFGLTAAVIAAASPTIGEEALIPAAAMKGVTVGAGLKGAMRVGQLEAGGMFLELAEMKDEYGNRIDPKTAVVASMSVGAINGGIELAEWAVLLKTFGIGGNLFNRSVGKVTKKLFAEGTVKELLARKVAQYGIALSAEVLQEIEQETSAVVFGELAKELNNARKGTDFKPITTEALKERYTEVTLESARAFGLLVLPGTTVSGVVELATQKPVETKAGETPTEGKTVEIEIPSPEQDEVTDVAEKFDISEEKAKAILERQVEFRRQKAEKPPSKPSDAITEPEAVEGKVVKPLAETAEVSDMGKLIFHGTDKTFDEFDVKMSADGSIWFTDNKSKIEKGEVAASGKGRIIERVINEKDLKLGGWEEADKFGTEELIQQGYDGLRLVEDDETTYQIFFPEKLAKVTPEAQQGVEGKQPAVAQKAAKPVEKKLTEKTDAELLDQRQPIKDIELPRRTPQQIKELAEVEDELVGRHEPETTDISKATRKKAIKETAEAIIDDDTYQVMLEAQETQAEQVGKGGMVFFEEKARGEVTDAIEAHPILKRYITFDKASKAPSWDQVVQRGGTEETDMVEFLDQFGKSLEVREQAGGINMAALQEAVDKQEFSYLEVLDIKYDMLKKGFAAQDINDTIKHWAIENEVDVEMVEGEYLPIEGKQDVKSKQEILRGLERTHRKTPSRLQSQEQKTIQKAQQLAFKDKKPRYITEKTGKDAGLFKVSNKPPTQGEYTIVTPPKAGEIKGTTEKGYAGLTAEELKDIKKLRQRIHATATVKGMTKKALSDLKLKHTKYRSLSGKVSGKKITKEQLETLLKAVQRTRPKRVGYKRVITKKTENKIQSLKENLKKKLQMTDEAYKEILSKEIHGKQPKYIDAKHFITETQGKDIIKRMHDAAEVLKARVSFDKAVEKNPEIAKEVKKLQTEISQKKKRDPYRPESMRYYAQQSEVRTGAPIFTMYTDLIDTNLEAHRTRHATMAALENKVPGFKEIAGNEVALNRVAQYIASKGTQLNRPLRPDNITQAEVKLAEEIQKVFKDYELKARVSKFFNWYYYDEGIAEFDRYKKEIHKAEDIYESQGKEELIEYLKTQTWGVIKSGYQPLEAVVLKIRPYKTGPKTVGKTHIKIRTDIEYHTQERNILQRLNSYTRQMDMLYNLSPKINAFVRLYEDNLSKFAEPNKVQESIEHFLSNLKKYNIEGNWVGDIMAKLYAQASQIIIMANPVLAGRNLFQNPAFEHDKTILFDTKNKNLTPGEIEYMETYVQQLRGMLEEYFMINERSLPGTKTLMKVLKKIKIYAWSDATNRQWGFWAKINQVKRAQEADSISEMMSQAKFEDMSELEQIRALEILARDGNEAMARYVSRVHVDDIHFLYERAQRSPAEMGSMGRVFGNLMLFPRAYTEKLAHQVSKLTSNTSSQQEKYRAAKILVSVMGGGILVGSVYSMITGRRNPYNPLNVLGFRLGGLLLGLVDDVNEAYNLSIRAIGGDKKALYALTTLLPRMADNFIPFYSWTLRGIEASTDTKNLDKKALRSIYELIDKEYKKRGDAYEMERNLVQALQYFFAGTSIDRKIEQEKAQKKGGRKQILRTGQGSRKTIERK